MDVHKIIPGFMTGELTPHATSRVDYEKYHAGLEEVENFLNLPQGPLTRRPGTKFVAEVKTSAKKTRLIKFQFNVTDTYVLECGENYIRVYEGTARVESGGSPVEITTTYTESQIWDIQYVQSADILYLTHPSHPPRKLSRTSDTAWTLQDITFSPPPSYVANTNLATTLSYADADRTGADKTYTAGASVFLQADEGRAIISGSGRAIIAEYTSATAVQVDVIDQMPDADPTPLASGAWYLTGSPVATCRPSAKAPARKTIYLVLEDPDKKPKTITSCSRASNTVTVTCAAAHGLSNGDYVSVYGTSARKFNIAAKVANVTANTFDYTVKGGGGTPASSTDGYCIKALTGFRSGDVGKYVKINSGLCKITQYTSVNDVNTDVDGIMVKADILSVLELGNQYPAEAGLWSLEVESFSSTAGYPSCVALYQQRLWFASTSQQPNTIWGSVTGEYENFTTGPEDDSSLDYTLTTQEKIRWMTGVNALVVGTYGEEMVLSAANNAALTPTNVRAITNTMYGSAGVMPVVVGTVILFVQRSGLKLREFTYNLESDGYLAPDLTILAEHITIPQVLNIPDYSNAGIVDMTYQKELNSHVWCVRKDGVLLCLAYYKEHSLFGWSRHATDGLFESVIAVPGTGRDRVWVVVKRTINGGTKRYVEYFEDGQWSGSTGFQCAQVNTDAAKVYANGSPQTSHANLDHLAGKTVKVIGDGILQADKVVPTSGPYTITIDTAATNVEIGLHYACCALTVRPEINLPDGTAQGRVKGWSELVARVWKTVGGYINDRPLEYYLVSGKPTMFSGDHKVRNLGYDESGRIEIRQYDPYPFTLLSLSGKLTIE